MTFFSESKKKEHIKEYIKQENVKRNICITLKVPSANVVHVYFNLPQCSSFIPCQDVSSWKEKDSSPFGTCVSRVVQVNKIWFKIFQVTKMTFSPPGNHNSFVGNYKPFRKLCAWGTDPNFIYNSNILSNFFDLVDLVLPDINGGQPNIVYCLQDEDK